MSGPIHAVLWAEAGQVTGWVEDAPGIDLVDGVVFWEIKPLPPRYGWHVTFELQGCGEVRARALEERGGFRETRGTAWCRTFLPLVFRR
jgi:hypothetical protein